MIRLFLALALVALAIILGPSLHRELGGTPVGAAFLVGLASGAALVAGFAVVWLLVAGRHRRSLPPSVRQLPRSRRRIRPQLRLSRGDHDHRNWIPVSTDQFDDAPTLDHTPRGGQP